MFKKVCCLIVCLMFAICLVACNSPSQSNGDGQEDSTSYDYSVDTLEVEETQTFAPCSFFNFIRGNKHAKNYFVESVSVSINSIEWESIKIDGSAWEFALLEKFPEGQYDIEIVANIPNDVIAQKTFKARLHVSNDNQDITGGIDYLSEVLILTEVHVGSQTKLYEFLGNNFHFNAYLWYPLKELKTHPWEYVLVDGVEWSKYDIMMKELPTGKYDITIKVSDEFKVATCDYEYIVEVDYPRTLTIPVKVT